MHALMSLRKFYKFQIIKQCEQYTPISDMQRQNVTSLSSSAGAKMHNQNGTGSK